MSTSSDQTRVRKSVWEYKEGDSDLEALKRAFRGIQALPWVAQGEPAIARLKSYINLASLHGIWDQYCLHHEIRFLFWHRIYLRYFEDALREFEPTVTLPYFDTAAKLDEFLRLSPEEQKTFKVLPDWLDQEPFNTFPFSVEDGVRFLADKAGSKHGYRYFMELTSEKGAHNLWNKGSVFRAKLTYQWGQLLQGRNMFDWLTDANNTTRFDFFTRSIEAFHDNGHLAFGIGEADKVDYANKTRAEKRANGIRPKDDPERYEDTTGWMNEVPLAAFDSIFWFHHSNIDRHFAIWQETFNKKTKEAIDEDTGELIPWTVAFPEFEGKTSEAGIWEDDVSYTDGYGSKVKILRTVPSSVKEDELTRFTFSQPAPQPAPFSAAEKRHRITVKQIDRRQTQGSFNLRVTFKSTDPDVQKSVTLEHFIFQIGKGCPNCTEHPLLSFSAKIPDGLPTPNFDVTISAVDLAGRPVDIGKPRIKIQEDNLPDNIFF